MGEYKDWWFIAEEIGEIFPPTVNLDINGDPVTLTLAPIIAINTKEIQSLRQRITLLEEENATIKQRLDMLENL